MQDDKIVIQDFYGCAATIEEVCKLVGFIMRLDAFNPNDAFGRTLSNLCSTYPDTYHMAERYQNVFWKELASNERRFKHIVRASGQSLEDGADPAMIMRYLVSLVPKE
jgi:hypothetical protein